MSQFGTKETEYDDNFEKLEKLKIEFQIKLFERALDDLTSTEAGMVLELLTSSPY